MKIGFIFECGPLGADLAVCRHLVNKIRPDVDFEPVTLENKPKLIANCGESASMLLELGCEEVFIIWDLFPAWRADGEKPCLAEDRANIFQSLAKSEVPVERVHLICIIEELEGWLLADYRAVEAYLSTAVRKVSIKEEKKPERIKNPKKLLIKYFKKHGKYPYIDRQHALPIIQNVADFSKMRRSETFCRFYLKLTGNML